MGERETKLGGRLSSHGRRGAMNHRVESWYIRGGIKKLIYVYHVRFLVFFESYSYFFLNIRKKIFITCPGVSNSASMG